MVSQWYGIQFCSIHFVVVSNKYFKVFTVLETCSNEVTFMMLVSILNNRVTCICKQRVSAISSDICYTDGLLP